MYNLIFIIIQFICIINAQIYDRIPLWEVEHHILEFVHDNYLHNCYKHTGINEIKLKCMNNPFVDTFSLLNISLWKSLPAIILFFVFSIIII